MSDTYTPTDGDVGETLTAVAMYTDGHGAMKSAVGEAANATAQDTRNRAPVFEDQDSETEGDQSESTTIMVEENTKALAGADDDDAATDVGTDNIGSPINANDPDPNADLLVYTLSGADAGLFRVRQDDPDTNNVDEGGQIEVAAGTELNHESRTSYRVTLTAEDSFGASDTIMVTITVTDLDEAPEIMRAPDANVAPEFASATTSRTVAENTPAGENIGNPVEATDDNNDALTYTLRGTDAASFDIDSATGQLSTKAALDYETKASYSVTVTARDPDGLSDFINVTITVTDLDDNVAPEFPGTEDGARSVAENTPAGEDIGSPVAANDANGDALTYTLGGTDAASFDIDSATGQLMTLAALDYETKASYSVTVTARDPDGLSDSIDVTITVTDVDDNVAPEFQAPKMVLGAWRKTQ